MLISLKYILFCTNNKMWFVFIIHPESQPHLCSRWFCLAARACRLNNECHLFIVPAKY